MRRCSQEATLLLKAGFHTSRWKDIERIICYDYWALPQLVERFWGQKEGDVNILGKAMLFHFVFRNFRKAVYSAYLRFFSAVSNKQDRKCHKTVWKWICDGSVSSSWLFMASANLQTHPEAGWEMGNDTCCIQYLRLQLMLASAQLLHWQLADIWAQRLVIQLIIITSSL